MENKQTLSAGCDLIEACEKSRDTIDGLLAGLLHTHGRFLQALILELKLFTCSVPIQISQFKKHAVVLNAHMHKCNGKLVRPNDVVPQLVVIDQGKSTDDRPVDRKPLSGVDVRNGYVENVPYCKLKQSLDVRSLCKSFGNHSQFIAYGQADAPRFLALLRKFGSSCIVSLQIWNPYRHQDCGDRSDGLNPSRPVELRFTDEGSRAKQSNQCGPKDRVKRPYPLEMFIFRHAVILA